MPGKKHLRGVGPKEQREYEHIKKSAQKSGRYGKRAAEVAARTVMKQHKKKGHRKGQQPIPDDSIPRVLPLLHVRWLSGITI